MRGSSYGDTKKWDHHILLIRRSSYDPQMDIKYSRCPRDLTPKEIWEYYKKQVKEAFPWASLIYLVEDLDHVHPMVMHHGMTLPNGLDAHMP